MRSNRLTPLTRFERATRLLGLALVAPLLAALALPVAVRIARGPDLGFEVRELDVVGVSAQGPAAAAGLRPGDRIAGLAGKPVTSMHGYYAALAGATDLAPLAVTVRRDAGLVTVQVLPTRPATGHMIRDYSIWITGLCFLAIGWWVFLQQGDLVARNFFALCLIFAFFLSEVPDHPDPTYMHVKELVRLLMQNLLPAYFLRFFLLFPSPDRRTPRAATQAAQRLLLVPGLLLFVCTAALDLLHPAPTETVLFAAAEHRHPRLRAALLRGRPGGLRAARAQPGPPHPAHQDAGGAGGTGGGAGALPGGHGPGQRGPGHRGRALADPGPEPGAGAHQLQPGDHALRRAGRRLRGAGGPDLRAADPPAAGGLLPGGGGSGHAVLAGVRGLRLFGAADHRRRQQPGHPAPAPGGAGLDRPHVLPGAPGAPRAPWRPSATNWPG